MAHAQPLFQQQHRGDGRGILDFDHLIDHVELEAGFHAAAADTFDHAVGAAAGAAVAPSPGIGKHHAGRLRHA